MRTERTGRGAHGKEEPSCLQLRLGRGAWAAALTFPPRPASASALSAPAPTTPREKSHSFPQKSEPREGTLWEMGKLGEQMPLVRSPARRSTAFPLECQNSSAFQSSIFGGLLCKHIRLLYFFLSLRDRVLFPQESVAKEVCFNLLEIPGLLNLLKIYLEMNVNLTPKSSCEFTFHLGVVVKKKQGAGF